VIRRHTAPTQHHIMLTCAGVGPPRRRSGHRGFYSRGKTAVKEFPDREVHKLVFHEYESCLPPAPREKTEATRPDAQVQWASLRQEPDALMAAKPKTEAAQHLDEERLAHALVSRGLVSREEMHQVRAAAGNLAGLEELLERLVEAGFLTASQ